MDKNKLQKIANKKMDGELTHLLYVQSSPGIIASLFIAICFLFLLRNVTPIPLLLGWFGVMFTIGSLRYALVKVYLSQPKANTAHHFWKDIFIVCIALAGGTWGYAAIYLVPDIAIYQTFVTCILAGLSGSAIPFFAASRAACAAYIVPMLLPYAFDCFLKNNDLQQILGCLILIYLFLLVITSFRTHKAVYNALKLKFENDDLLNTLSATKKDMEIINLELQAEVNERKTVEQTLRESEEQYRLVTDALPVLISYIDRDLNYRFNNKSHVAWYGKPLNKITGKHIKEIIGPTAYGIFLDHYQKMDVTKSITYETIMQFREDDERYVSVTLIPHIKEGEPRGVFSLVSDMTPRINYLATHDALTDLPNRSFFNARFAQALKRASRHNYKVALFFLDLDHFKNINDTLGHEVGDNLLIKVGERIKNTLKPTDNIARQGGDEFTVLLENVTVDDVIKFAKKIRHAFSFPFKLHDHEIFITTSMGISIYPEDGLDMQTLLKNADMAIYQAKERGRNTFELYTDKLNKKIVQKQIIQTGLRNALEQDQFYLEYQPIINITDNTLAGLEALIRWQHPHMGLIPPNDFIPVAEEVGLIVPIGEWIIRSVCQQTMDWHKQGLAQTIRTCINLSARQFREKNLAEMITLILKEKGLNPEHLTLELTETLIMQDIEYSTNTIRALKDLGISISVDDFGTGYSSLNYLRRFPIDTLKIDKSFITHIMTNNDDASIVKAIIALAHSLKMKVIAEGVETTEQYNFLKDNHCDGIQGFLLSKPLSVIDITQFIKNTASVKQLINKLQTTHEKS